MGWRCRWTLGKMGPSWMQREEGDLARQAGVGVSSWYWTAEEVKHPQDDRRHRRRARHGTKAALCTEYISLCALSTLTCCILDNCNHEYCFTLSIYFRRINHMAVKKPFAFILWCTKVILGTILVPDEDGWCCWCCLCKYCNLICGVCKDGRTSKGWGSC